MIGDCMKFLKFLVVLLTIFASFTFAYGYLSDKEVISTIIQFYDRTPSKVVNNEYVKDLDVGIVKPTNNFIPTNRSELLNIYYTIISSGMKEFTFYCSNQYINCINDMIEINDNADLLSQINSLVSVYNSFKSIKTSYTSNGKITLYISRVYSDYDIKMINKKLDDIEKDIIDRNKSDKDNILAIHDYIINNTKYNDDEKYGSNEKANTAVGALFLGLAKCNGYTDAAALFMDRLNIKNVRIVSVGDEYTEPHIWNLVYLDGKWLHLDLTWDDPVNNLNKDFLYHDNFLKTTQEDDNKHLFDKDFYYFAK